MKISLLIKKIVCICLVFALSVSNNFLHEIQKINKVYADDLINLDIPAWDGTIADTLLGEGTQSNPYQISNGGELAFLASRDSNSEYFELTNDIDLANNEWTPIGNGSAVFDASYFNGNGYNIYNLAMTTKDLGYYSLFGYISYSTIHDVNIINCNINMSSTESPNAYRYIGALAGHTIMGSIYNCSASGIITVTRPNGTDWQDIYIGGLCGDMYSLLSLENCKSNVNINFINFSADGHNVIIGGMLGYCDSGATVNIDNCSYTGNIEVTNDLDSLIVGGLVGELSRYNGDGFTLSNSYFVGNITVQNCSNSCIGGLFGLSYSPVKLNNCFSSCNIVVGEISSGNIVAGKIVNSSIGGLIGSQYDDSCNVTNCYSSHGSVLIGFTDANSYVGGLIGNDVGNTNSLINCYSGNVIKIYSPTAPNNIGSFIGTADAATMSNCYFDKDLSEYVSAVEKDNENIIGLTTKQMIGYSALENMSGLFEVTDSNPTVEFDYYYLHYPQLKIFFNSDDKNTAHYSELSTRAQRIDIMNDISDIQTYLNYLINNINDNFLNNQNEINNINKNFAQEFANIKRNQNTLENKINAIFMKICGRPIY